jgi:hypothetical protein
VHRIPWDLPPHSPANVYNQEKQEWPLPSPRACLSCGPPMTHRSQSDTAKVKQDRADPHPSPHLLVAGFLKIRLVGGLISMSGGLGLDSDSPQCPLRSCDKFQVPPAPSQAPTGSWAPPVCNLQTGKHSSSSHFPRMMVQDHALLRKVKGRRWRLTSVIPATQE